METVNLSLRLPARESALLEAHSARRASRPATLAAELLSRALRSLTHPAIDYEHTPDGGFRARLAGSRVAVWVVVATVRQLGRKEAAHNLGLPPALVAAALNYAADFPEEIAQDEKMGRRSLKECGLEEATL
ncbi:MAG: hypothetical protein ACK45B_06560 [Limisphaerales bacterium]|jgi:uncharacterized protein (DUF433 family)